MTKQQILSDSQELFFYAYRAFTSAPDEMLALRGWNRVHHRLLHFIGREPGMTIGNLLDKLGVSKQAVHPPLKALIGAGMVNAVINPDDLRVKRLHLTPAGQSLSNTLSAPQYQMFAQIIEQCGQKAFDNWLLVMQEIRKKEVRNKTINGN